jgi:hypothetical protein
MNKLCYENREIAGCRYENRPVHEIWYENGLLWPLTARLDVSPAAVGIPASGTAQTFTVTSNTDWSIS